MTSVTTRVCLGYLLLALTSVSLGAVDKHESQAFYEDALERFRARNFSEAEIQVRNALQRDPDNLAARILFGRTLMQSGQPHAAIHEFRRAQAMGGDANLFVVSLANAYLRIAEPEEVVSQFKPETYSANVAGELYLAIGEAHMRLGDYEQARMAFVESAGRLTFDARPVIGRARIALASGQHARADKLLKTAVVLGPDNPDAWLWKAIKHRDSGEFDDAKEAFEKTLALKPNSVRALVGRTAMWMDLGETDKARADLEQARALGTATLEHVYLNALLLFQEGKGEEARESLRARAAEIESIRKDVRTRLPKVELMLGVVAYFERNHRQAEAHLRRFLSAVPGHRGGRRYLAGTYLALKEFDEVIALYQPRASMPAPGDPLALAMLAEAYRAKGDYATAEQLIDNAYQMAPQLAAVGVRLAMDRISTGRADKAVEDLEKLAGRFPQFVEVQAQLVRAYAKVGRMQEAKVVVDRLLTALPEDPRVQILSGTVQLASGDMAGARAHFERAHAIDPQRIPPRINLARIERLQGNTEKAESRYRQILEEFPDHATTGVELAGLLLARGDVEAATHYTDVVLKANPERVDAHQMKVAVMFASDASREDLEKAANEVLVRFEDNPEVRLLAGRIYRRLGDLNAAAIHFREAAKGMPSAVGPLFSIANKQFGIGDFGGARNTLARAGVADPDHLGVLVLRASVASQLKRYETAAFFVNRARTIHGEKAPVLTVEGDVQMAQGRTVEAVKAYQKAFDISPNTKTVTTLFRARVVNDQIDEAMALMDGWIGNNPGDLDARRLYARLMVRERDWQRAGELYEALMQDGVRDALLLNNLAVVYQNRSDERALVTARAAYERAPDDPSIIDTYGWVLAENGDPRKGLALLRDAYSRLSTEPVIRYHMGLALTRIAGREAEAREELQAALAQGGPAEAPWKEDAKKVLQILSKAN